MRAPLLLLLLTTTACAPELVCPGATTFELRAQVGLDCAAVAADVARIREGLAAAPARWQVPAQAFDATFAGLQVFVHADPTFARDGRSWVGRYNLWWRGSSWGAAETRSRTSCSTPWTCSAGSGSPGGTRDGTGASTTGSPPR